MRADLFEALLALGAERGILGDADADAIRGAFSSRGKRRGLLKASAPKSGTPAYTAWQSLMGYVAPVRCSVFGMIWAPDGERERFERIDRWVDTLNLRPLLNAAAQRPCEFNLFAMNHDPAAIAMAFAVSVGISEDTQ